MKRYKLSFFRTLLYLTILLIMGCSVNIGAPSFTMTATIMPTPTVALLPITGKIAFVSDNNGKSSIFVMNIYGSGQKNLVDNLIDGLKPAWSPDGQYIAFTSNHDGVSQIFIMKSDGSDQRQLTRDKAGADNPAWSPDGQYIIFISNQDSVFTDQGISISEVYIMRPDGSGQRRLTNNQDFERDLSWSPKGDVIAVSINPRASTGIYFPEAIYLMGLDGMIQKQLTDFASYNEHPAWSPSGEFIVFSSHGDGESGIYIMKADGSDKVYLTKSTNTVSSSLYVNNISPSWSPNGKYILFSSNLDGDYDIYSVKPDGFGLTQLTNMLGDESFPVWSP